MSGIEDHHSLVGQYEEGGVVVVVGLEARSHEHILLHSLGTGLEVHLRSLDGSMYVDVSYVCGVNGSVGTLIVDGAWVGKPAPGTFVGHYAA